MKGSGRHDLRERLAVVLRGQPTDCVPVSPDASNMIPARMAGKSFIDLYLYEEIPMWQAYIRCVRHFGFDALMDGGLPVLFDDLDADQLEQQEYIVHEEQAGYHPEGTVSRRETLLE